MATVGAQEVLATALRTNETLTELRLGGNGIGDPGAIALAEALPLLPPPPQVKPYVKPPMLMPHWSFLTY